MISAVVLLAMALSLNVSDLKLVSVYRLNITQRFDFSGMVKVDDSIRTRFGASGDFLIVSDQNRFIYDAKINGDMVDVSPLLDLKELGVNEPFDLEGIDSQNGILYVVNEAQENFIVLKGRQPSEVSVIQPSPKISQKFPVFAMGNRFGLEGIAVRGDRVFLAKEKTPLAIFEFDLPSAEIFLHQRSPIGSQSDLKIRGDDLFILERERRCVLETKFPLQRFERCFSFKRAIENPELDYYRLDPKGSHQPQWGNAEALEIDGDLIWLGIDNNANSLKARAEVRPALFKLMR